MSEGANVLHSQKIVRDMKGWIEKKMNYTIHVA